VIDERLPVPSTSTPELGKRPPSSGQSPVPSETDRSVLLQAWIDNRMERDRSLLSLSSGGIGLVVTLLATGLVASPELRALASVSMLSFAGSLACCLSVFRENSKYVKALLGGTDSEEELIRLDRRLLGWFGLGVSALLALGLALIL
jgi:hypothetical protein